MGGSPSRRMVYTVGESVDLVSDRALDRDVVLLARGAVIDLPAPLGLQYRVRMCQQPGIIQQKALRFWQS